MGKKASQAGQACMSSSKEKVLRSEDTLEEEPDERERLDMCETFFWIIRKNNCCAFCGNLHCRRYQECLLRSRPTFVSMILNLG